MGAWHPFWLIEENTVRHANGAGIDIGRRWSSLPRPKTVGHHIVRRNTVTDCGVCGIGGLALANSLVEDNVILRNAFHDVEIYFETAGIRTHHNRSSVIRRNLIADTIHGADIWMDFMNVNSRCTQNILLRKRTAMFGAIFIEASSRLNLIDHNVIIETQGAGVYEQGGPGQIFAHNFIAKSTRPAVILRGKVTDRKVHKRPISGGKHHVLNNVLIGNAGAIEEHGPKSVVEGNLIKATGDEEPPVPDTV
ncbi:MAG: right-handed parallel beta-helix repeat-containing protein [Planctomycetota bacterium]